MLTLLIILIFFHFLVDYPLQGDFLSKAKNHTAPIPGVPWYQALGAHSFMHAFAVFFMTGSFLLLIIEFVGHSAIDYAKCSGKLSFNQDQALHILMKVCYVAFLSVTVGFDALV